MIKAILLTVVLIFASVLGACSGSNKEKETPKSQANVLASNTNVTSANIPAARKDGDADDVTAKKAASNSNASNVGGRSSDRDDVRKAVNSNSSRKDADDKGRQDSDRDDDDR